MMKVRAKVDVYVEGSYRYRGEVFVHKTAGEGFSDPNLETVPPETPVGIPAEPKTGLGVSVAGGPTIAGNPSPQIVFDFDDSRPAVAPEKPSHLDLFS